MEKQIHDQLLDTSAVNVLRSSIFESALLGTGIVKGPFNHYKRIHKWEELAQKDACICRTKKPYRVLNMYLYGIFIPIRLPQTVDDCEYVIQRHRMNRSQLRGLITQPFFYKDAIEECLAKGPNYEDKYYEDTIREDETEPYYR